MKQQQPQQFPRGSGSSSSPGEIPIEFNNAALGAASRHIMTSKKLMAKKGSVQANALPPVDEECESDHDDVESEGEEEEQQQQPAPDAIVLFDGPSAVGKKPAAADPIASLLKAAGCDVVAAAQAAPKYRGRGRGRGRGRARGTPASAATTGAIPKAKPKPAAMKKPSANSTWPFEEVRMPGGKKVCCDWL